MTASSTRPYMIRAIYEWCNDNGFTPHIAVVVDERTLVPREHVRAGEIVLNLSASATHRLNLGNDLVEFQARFSGVVRELSIPVENITAIYARENGHGMAFEVPKALANSSAQGQTDQLTDQDTVSAEVSSTSSLESPTSNDPAAPARVRATPTPVTGARRSNKLTAVSPVSEGPKRATVTSLVKQEPVVSVQPSAGRDTEAPADEPSDPDSGTGGRGKSKGRAKLTRIK